MYKNDWECPPRCFGQNLRKEYFRFRQNGTPAGVPFCHFHKKGRRDKMHFSVTAPLVKKAFGALRRACRGKTPPSANADRSAAQKPHWGFHCYAALRKRGRSKREIINNDSAEDAQSATTTTAASGGNREELLGQRPARRACRPRHDADAGCRNPISGGHFKSSEPGGLFATFCKKIRLQSRENMVK